MEYLGVRRPRPHTRTLLMRVGTGLTALTLALALAACSGSDGGAEPDPDAEASASSTAEASPRPEALSKVIQPGRPGEPNQTLDPDATVESPESNAADTAFMQMMIPHHAQALEMGDLAMTRAKDEQVIAISRRIAGAQGPEIVSMSAWLQGRGLAVPLSMADLQAMGDMDGMSGMEGMDMENGTMVGMLTPTQMTALAAAEGAQFDRLFLTGMIQHHQGAIDMAASQLEGGSDLIATELASEISFGQQAEIQRMQELLDEL